MWFTLSTLTATSVHINNTLPSPVFDRKYFQSHHSLAAVQCWHCPAYSSIICCFLASKYLHSNIPNTQNLSLSWNNNKFKFLVQFLLVLGISQNAAPLRVCWSDLQCWEAEMTGGVFVEMVVTGHWTPDTGDHQPPATSHGQLPVSSCPIMYTNNGDSEDKDNDYLQKK